MTKREINSRTMKKKYNVLYVSHEPHLRMGAQNSMAHLIENLDRERFNPMCVLPAPGELSERLEKAGCPCLYVPMPHIKPKNILQIPKTILRIRKYIKKYDIDIIHPDFEADIFLCGMAKAFTGCRLVWHVRLTTQYTKDILLRQFADAFIGISEGTRQRFPDSVKITRKFEVIYNGVDCDVFTPPQDRNEAREKLGLPTARFLLIFVGQLKPGKGIFDIADAVKILGDELPPEKMPQLLYIGTPPNRDEYKRLKEIVSSYGLDEYVDYIPQQSKIYEWMQAADALILPSHEQVEGMGRVLFEAMACGAAAIGSDTSGVREALTPESGILVPEKSPRSIADAVKKLILSPALLQKYRIKGRQRALEHFNIKNHARKVEEFYNKVHNPHP